MCSHFLYCILFSTIFSTSGIVLEDLEPLFGSHDCIPASLVSLAPIQDAPLMLDSSSGAINTTVADKAATSTIHELAQYNDIEYVYKLVSEEGPPHAKTYTIDLLLGDEVYQGSGPSLKKAQRAAAAVAMENTLYEHPPEKIPVEDNNLTPTVILNNVSAKLGIAVSYQLLTGKEQVIESYGAADSSMKTSAYSKINSSSDPLRVPSQEPQISGPFTVKVQVGEFVFKGVGHSVQGARHDAALRALKAMEKEALFKDNVCERDESWEECRTKKDSLKSPITRIYEAAQKQKLNVEFNIISESGKSHQKAFVTECKLGEYVTEGHGNSKKESKREAAEKMLQYLPDLGDFYNEKMIVSGFSGKKKKKNRKKNKKIARATDGGSFVDSVSHVVSSFWTDEPEKGQSAPKKPKFSYKDRLLEVGQGLNIPIEFTDLDKYKGNFLSVLSLQVRPPQVCLGKAVTREKSHEAAALYGLKFLQKHGILEKTRFSEDYSSFEADFKMEEEPIVIPFDSEKESE